MKRINLFEFEDLPWFPHVIREGGTDYLRNFLNQTGFYDVCAPILIELLDKTGSNQLVDLCSGGGGGIASLVREMRNRSSKKHSIILTDKFPNLNAFRFLSESTNGAVGHHPASVDALTVPAALPGLLTMFSAMHHFGADSVSSIISNAASQKRTIAFFDGGDKNLLAMLGVVVLLPVTFLLFTPLFRPFTFRRLFFTYLLPAIPLMTMWDGLASILRLYKPEELLRIARKAAPDYEWDAGYLKNKVGMRVVYLTGYPA